MSTTHLPSLEGKVILLTGATEGIGKAAAHVFARRRATLVVVGRNAAKTHALVADLARETGNERIESLVGDLSSLADIRAIAAAFKARHDRLDVLANNAGGVFARKSHSADGIELTFALNHLGYFLLTHELMDVLSKTPGARVVSTSSGAHRRGKIEDLDELATRSRRYSGFSVYSDSKLANILFTRELARRLRRQGVVANCFHPGLVRTAFAQNNPGTAVAMMFRFFMSMFARTPEKGADTLVWLATSDEAGKISGEYCQDRRVMSVRRSLPTRMLLPMMLLIGVIGGLVAVRLHQPASRGQNLLALLVAGWSTVGWSRSERWKDERAKELWAFSEKACGISSSGASK